VFARSTTPLPTPVQPGNQGIPITRQHLAALDGVRFLAAFCVLAGHGYWYVVQQQVARPDFDPIASVMDSIPGLGMTLFFVLSGFVIHFNYYRTVGVGRTGTFDFFIARFSRLYPLFLVVFTIDFIHLLRLQGYFSGNPRLDFDLFGPLPLFLSFTQTWLFIPFDGYAIYEHYGALTSHAQATGAMWSLSTEWLFYAVYPLFSVWLSRRAGRPLAALAIAVALAGLCYYVWAAYHIPTLKNFGLARFGSPELADTFVGWVVFYSPAGRISEFLLGACAAQLCLSSRNTEVRFSRWPAVSCAALAAAILVWMAGSSIFQFGLSGVNASCAAALVAAFVLLVAQYSTPVSRLLSRPVLVKCGEASYSLYLLHWFIMHEWAAPYAVQFSSMGRVSVYLVGILVSIAVSRASYLVIERPALRWLRANFKWLKLHIVIGAVFVVITFFSAATSLQIQAVKRSCASVEQPICPATSVVPVPSPAN
jgi:peptidoglycan/LPS O-acetylase OafA/YrhL